MKPRIMSRILAALVLGVFLGCWAHHDYVSGARLGRDAFLAKESVRYNKFFAKPLPIAADIVASVIVIGCTIGIYEVVAFTFSKLLRRGDDGDAE